jgi:methyl-accepting chemotaxis protein
MTEALENFRSRGVRVLALGGWLSIIALLAIGLQPGYSGVGIVVPLAILITVLPTICAIRNRHDLSARLSVALMVALHPALYLYLADGHPWQMDLHLFFLTAVASLTLLCDWKPLALASILGVLHHALIQWLAPNWAFSGSVDMDRVLIHGLAIIIEFAVLAHVTRCLRALIIEQSEARAHSETLVVSADNARGFADALRQRAETALSAARVAEEFALSEKERGRAAAIAAREQRQTDFLKIAENFEDSVSVVVDAVNAAAQNLAKSGGQLSNLTSNVRREAAEAAAASTQATSAALAVAASVGALQKATETIVLSAAEQARRSGAANLASAAGHEAVCELAGRVTHIGEFATVIRTIAKRTKLLSLNASIEAARVGEVGAGFGVVAGEVKVLAGQASDATAEITELTQSIHGAASVAQMALNEIASALTDVTRMAQSISVAIAVGSDSVSSIEDNASDAASGSELTAQRVRNVVLSIADTDELAVQFGLSIRDLLSSASNLRRATDKFVGELRANIDISLISDHGEVGQTSSKHRSGQELGYAVAA